MNNNTSFDWEFANDSIIFNDNMETFDNLDPEWLENCAEWLDPMPVAADAPDVSQPPPINTQFSFDMTVLEELCASLATTTVPASSATHSRCPTPKCASPTPYSDINNMTATTIPVVPDLKSRLADEELQRKFLERSWILERPETKGKKEGNATRVACNNKRALDAKWSDDLLQMSIKDMNRYVKTHSMSEDEVAELRAARRRYKSRVDQLVHRIKRDAAKTEAKPKAEGFFFSFDD